MKLKNNVYINKWYTIAGKDEYKGNIKDANKYIDNYYYGEKTFEDAECKMIEEVISNLNVPNKNYLAIGGNLSNQLSTLNISMSKYPYSFIGVYSACASFVESLILAGNIINNDDIMVITSSHNLTSERQFRFPIEYGSLKKNYGTNTITCAIGAIVNKIKSPYKLGNYTIGKVVDSTIVDVNNMGAVMAPAAAKTIYDHLYENGRTIDDYDYIITGDLGILGLKLLSEILKSDYGIETNKIIDAGSLIYKDEQKKGMGGSGPTCLPYVFFNRIIKEKFKRVLLVGTGALHSPTLVNQGLSIPAVAHAIEIEVVYD